jgi:hypothetical protein
VIDEQHKSRETSEKGQLTDSISTEHRGTVTSRNEQLTAFLVSLGRSFTNLTFRCYVCYRVYLLCEKLV